MRIEALTLYGIEGTPALQWMGLSAGLNAVYGPPHSAQSTIAEFLAHVLFGQTPSGSFAAAAPVAPTGEVVVQKRNQRYRLRKYFDGLSTAKLTVAGLNGAPVDHSTIHDLTCRLSPTILAALCAVSFREPPSIGRLLNREFAREFNGLGGPRSMHGNRRTAELSARRDSLAQELETRIAGERRVSKELDARWRELDRLVRDRQQQEASGEQRLQAVESALAETDARLRYRRLELNVQLRWHAEEPECNEPQLSDLDEQIARSRAMLSDLAQREASVRARLAETQSVPSAAASAGVDQRAWLSVARQLAADLTGEVARLARASSSQQCVCRDAHPRLRPIAETIDRQLDLLESLVNEQHNATNAAELQKEVDSLSRTQTELRRHLENLLDRRQVLARGVRPRLRPAAHGMSGQDTQDCVTDGDDVASFSVADVEQLEERRFDLEQERFHLTEQVNTHHRTLRDLRAQRDTVERQRAALLSARSIEHVQRELADVQRKLEHAAGSATDTEDCGISPENIARASDFLAQLTNGSLVRLIVLEYGRGASVVGRAGETLAVESLPVAQRNLVYLSLCLGLLSGLAERGIWLPLVLDDPFTNLDAGSTAALAAVLEGLCRQGHQVLVFTSQPAAAERLTSVGAAIRNVEELRQAASDATLLIGQPLEHPTATVKAHVRKHSKRKSATAELKRNKSRAPKPLNGEATSADRSDAA